MSDARYPLRKTPARVINADTLAAHLHGVLLGLIHADDMTAEEAVNAVIGVAGLAHSLAAHWRLFGNARRTFYRSCGLDGDGMVTAELVARLTEARLPGDPDVPVGGEER